MFKEFHEQLFGSPKKKKKKGGNVYHFHYYGRKKGTSRKANPNTARLNAEHRKAMKSAEKAFGRIGADCVKWQKEMD